MRFFHWSRRFLMPGGLMMAGRSWKAMIPANDGLPEIGIFLTDKTSAGEWLETLEDKGYLYEVEPLGEIIECHIYSALIDLDNVDVATLGFKDVLLRQWYCVGDCRVIRMAIDVEELIPNRRGIVIAEVVRKALDAMYPDE